MLEVYGWASWSPRKGIIVLRNPSNTPAQFTLDIQKAFELPDDAAKTYTARSPWKKDARMRAVQLEAGKPFEVRLAPFEVITLDATPRK